MKQIVFLLLCLIPIFAFAQAGKDGGNSTNTNKPVIGTITDSVWTLDDFSPADKQDNGKILWQNVSGGKAELTNLVKESDSGLQVTADLTDKDVSRIALDRRFSTPLDLSAWNDFQLHVKFEDSTAFTACTLYFQSGIGWYSLQGIQTSTSEGYVFKFNKNISSRTEGTVNGWDKISTIRISFWKMKECKTSVKFSKLCAIQNSILFLLQQNREGIALWLGKDNRAKLQAEFSKIGLQSDAVEFSCNATVESLLPQIVNRQTIIVPYDKYVSQVFREKLIRWGKENKKSVWFISEHIQDKYVNSGAVPPQEVLEYISDDFIACKAVVQYQADRLQFIMQKNNSAVDSFSFRPKNAAELYRWLVLCEKKYQSVLKRWGKKIRSNYASMPVRAWWNHSGCGAYQGDWARTAKELKAGGFTDIYSNALWEGEALYPSKIVPVSTIVEQYGDRLDACIKACHAQGIKVHLWKVCFRLDRHPHEYFIDTMRKAGRLQMTASGVESPWLCPSHPDNIKQAVDSMVEAVKKYPLDGIQFDYIRFNGPQVCFCPGCRERFEKSLGKKVENWPNDCLYGKLKDQWSSWRQDCISHIVKLTHDAVKKIRPNIQISADVFSGYPGCCVTYGQDWSKWAHQGWVDFLCPMNYVSSADVFENLYNNQKLYVPEGFPLYPGIGEYRIPIHETLNQIDRAQKMKLKGFTIFNLNEPTAKRIIPLFTNP